MALTPPPIRSAIMHPHMPSPNRQPHITNITDTHINTTYQTPTKRRTVPNPSSNQRRTSTTEAPPRSANVR